VSNRKAYAASIEKLPILEQALTAAESAADAVSSRIILTGSVAPPKYTFSRLVGGLVASASTSKATTQTYFLDFNLTAPVRFFKQYNEPLESWLWLFLNPRITSVQQDGSAASNLNISKDFFSSDLSGNLTKVAQGLDVTTGAEIALLKPRDGINWFSNHLDGNAKLGASLVFGIGASTPFSNDKPVTYSLINTSILAAYPKLALQPSTITNVAFVTQDRSRFFRKYYTGLRFKTFAFDPSVTVDCDDPKAKPVGGITPPLVPCPAPQNRFPGVFDLTVGQDESVTGGQLRHWVFRMDAVYPFPFVPGMHILGSVNLALAKNKLTSPVTIQSPSPAPVENGSNINTVRQVVPQLDRDIFRIGVGVDIDQILKALKKKPANSSADAKAGKSP
jgi:hypothetical protein